ncbi:trigger factor [Candidatus Pseudothioglobus singularis]|jgi:trigger factor|uniref:Trigger factor n=1 Tax=Candidatus Pseudothioglobus singularis PS1 TaxID=1125411 RepID=A0A0M4LZ66_9GAMM|nr:trigger factor [Candidatus Pseudothioglobus singularis]MDA9145043.1 trigger factor [Candidatus Thioglobus sp.]MDP0596083.1 trigger factor [SAR86 cluster bacterium]ALE01424.1 trigger factor [Candidatus Pseudothioglobus singularis PS1]ANQ66089.1 trigger factor [Candidatus Pseudothioglobus singularis]MDA7437782.1 trigger factor [Candidatus Pseudothioglobus singularis]|tara:strand:+ start:881 stop:2179 length:1299 start_codon:yes stop_codon:yes gene_type:complete
MKTSLTTLEGLKRSLTVELPVDIFNERTEKIIKGLAGKVRVDGFRKGKIPPAVLKQRFGGSAKSDAATEIVGETLADALTDADVSPATQPSLTNIDTENADSLIYTLEFEVYPEIKVNALSKLTIDQVSSQVTEEDEERALQDLQDRSTEYKTVKRKSKDGDRLIIDFEGLLDGESFEGGAAEGFEIVLGKGTMIEGFEKGLIDVASGKTVEVNATFPEDYHVENLAGREAVFKVKVNEIGSPIELKRDDEFAKKYGEKDFETMKSRMTNQMKLELDSRLVQQNKDTAFSALLEANDFEVPEGSISSEAEKLQQDMESRMEQQGMPSKGKLPAEMFNEEAARRVKLGLLINKIATDSEITAEKDLVDAKLNEMSLQYGESAQQMIDWYNTDPSRLANIESIVVEDLVAKHVAEKAKVTTTDKTFLEIMNTQN